MNAWITLTQRSGRPVCVNLGFVERFESAGIDGTVLHVPEGILTVREPFEKVATLLREAIGAKP